jgi:hypothetical protein
MLGHLMMPKDLSKIWECQNIFSSVNKLTHDNIGIIGGSGYTKGELNQNLDVSSQCKLDFVYSTTNAGKLHVAAS